MSLKFVIRPETLADAAAIAEVAEAAFATLEISRHTEQFIVEALRAAKALTVSLVAETEGRVIGHVAFSPVTISDGTPDWYGLGPVSVLPAHQGRGVGKALIREGLGRLKERGARGCCLVGHPEYYRKLGFRSIPGLVHEGVPPEFFLALSFEGPVPQGTVAFHEGFGATGHPVGAGAPDLTVREMRQEESAALGRLMVDVYSRLEGFPTPEEQPGYYEMLADIGRFSERKDAKVLVAVAGGELVGGVVYFGDMAQYGSGGIATTVKDASGIRLLGVRPEARGMGVGRALTEACIRLARESGHAQVVLHTTQAMKVAWGLYERMGFQRSEDLDFLQGALPVFGFRLRLGGRRP